MRRSSAQRDLRGRIVVVEISPDDQLEINEFALRMTPVEYFHQRRVDVEVSESTATLIESSYLPGRWLSVPLAQLRFDHAADTWTLYSATVDGEWQVYTDTYPTNHVGSLLDEVDRDPTGIFWG